MDQLFFMRPHFTFSIAWNCFPEKRNVYLYFSFLKICICKSWNLTVAKRFISCFLCSLGWPSCFENVIHYPCFLFFFQCLLLLNIHMFNVVCYSWQRIQGFTPANHLSNPWRLKFSSISKIIIVDRFFFMGNMHQR